MDRPGCVGGKTFLGRVSVKASEIDQDHHNRTRTPLRAPLPQRSPVPGGHPRLRRSEVEQCKRGVSGGTKHACFERFHGRRGSRLVGSNRSQTP